MKKILWCVPAALVLGVLASILRAYELAFGFDFMTELPTDKEWITVLLMCVAALLGVVLFLLIGKKKPEAKEPVKSNVYTGFAFFASAVMLALGGYAFFENQIKNETILYVFAALSILNAMSFALLGAKNLRDNESPIYAFFAFIQVLWATLAVILVFRERVSEPIAEYFIFLLFAYLCILLFTYAQTGYVFGKNRFAVAFIAGSLGVYFAAIELIAPFIASALNTEYYLALDFKIILPLAAYLIYIPGSLFKIFRNENNIE